MADSFYPPPAWVRLRQSITSSGNYTPPADVGPVYLRIQGSNGGFGGAGGNGGSGGYRPAYVIGAAGSAGGTGGSGGAIKIGRAHV